MHPLDDPQAKLGRAEEHLGALHVGLRRYMNSNPYELVVEKQVNRWDDVRFKVNTEPPWTLGPIVGDFFFNLRSALDHLAWQLALLTTPEPSRNTQFPIFREKPSTDRERANWRRQTRDILPAAEALIESLQPYNRPYGRDTDTIWLVHEACNIDKHRVITPMGFRFRLPFRWEGTGRIFTGVINDGEQIALVPPGADMKQDIEPNLEINVAFDIGEPPSEWGAPHGVTIHDLHRMNEVIRDEIFPLFDHFFPPREQGEPEDSTVKG